MTTLVAYPDAGSGSTTVDGHSRRQSVDQTWSGIHDSTTATNSSKVSTAQTMARLQASATTNQWQRLDRGVATFDTSSIPAGATISSVTLTVYGTAKSNALGSTNIDVTDVALADNNDIVSGDYDGWGTTVHATKTYSSYTAAGANDFTLPTSSINKGGVTAYGFRLAWDTSNSAPTWSSGAPESYYSFTNADNGSNKPTLTVDYTTGAPTRTFATIL